MRRWRRQLVIGVSLVLVWAGGAGSVSDPTMNSTSYSVTESEVGGNGQFSSSSANYSINPTTDDGGSSLGETAVGNSTSTNYQTNSGFDTTAQPGLMLNITTSSVDLGVLSTGAASTGTAHFNIRDYTSSGYNVFMFGSAPTMGGHALAALTSDTSWSSNTERSEERRV